MTDQALADMLGVKRQAIEPMRKRSTLPVRIARDLLSLAPVHVNGTNDTTHSNRRRHGKATTSNPTIRTGTLLEAFGATPQAITHTGTSGTSHGRSGKTCSTCGSHQHATVPHPRACHYGDRQAVKDLENDLVGAMIEADEIRHRMPAIIAGGSGVYQSPYVSRHAPESVTARQDQRELDGCRWSVRLLPTGCAVTLPKALPQDIEQFIPTLREALSSLRRRPTVVRLRYMPSVGGGARFHAHRLAQALRLDADAMLTRAQLRRRGAG